MEVSIIIPVCNRAEIVKRTLKSVVEQTYRPLHVILVDNNSTDGTYSTLEEFKRLNADENFRVTVLQEPRQGASIARNAGLKSADSEWVMFFDSDDTMDAPLVESYVNKIREADGAADLVVTRSDVVKLNGLKRQQPYFEKDLIKYHILDSCLNTPRYIVRREFFIQAGTWNESLLGWDDWELGMRLLLQHPRIAFMGDAVMVHVFSSRASITGTDMKSRCGEWERVIDLIDGLIRKSDEPRKDTYLKYVEYRRILLAGQYAFDGLHAEADALYRNTYSRVRNDRTMRWLYPLFYKFIGIGGIGTTRILKLLIK